MRSSVAPNRLKIGTVKIKAINAKVPTNKAAKYRALLPTCRAPSILSAPNLRAITAEVPIPKPMVRLITVKLTGKVKPTAASSWVPIKLIKKVSTTLKLMSVSTPKITGQVIDQSVAPTGAVSNCAREPEEDDMYTPVCEKQIKNET